MSYDPRPKTFPMVVNSSKFIFTILHTIFWLWVYVPRLGGRGIGALYRGGGSAAAAAGRGGGGGGGGGGSVNGGGGGVDIIDSSWYYHGAVVRLAMVFCFEL